MKKIAFFFIALVSFFAFVVVFFSQNRPTISGAPPYNVDDGSIQEGLEGIPDIVNWKRPEGPLRVGLQVGHWKSDELPQELERLRGNTGASGNGKSEWEVNYAIAQLTAEYLKEEGIEVDILPATVPPKYWADVFVAIHADGHEDRTKSGFKIAAPRRDFTGKTEELISLMRQEYEEVTGLLWDEATITRNMRGYYAFAWWRFEHAIHPMTPAVILETGFLTTPSDAYLISETPQIPAKAIAGSLIKFLKAKGGS